MEETTALFKAAMPPVFEQHYQLAMHAAHNARTFLEIFYVLIFGAACFLLKENTFVLAAIIATGVLACPSLPLIYYLQVRKKLRQLTKEISLKKDENNVITFSFYESGMSIFTTQLGELTTQSVIKYENLIRIAYYKNFLFIYTSINQPHLLESGPMETGTFNDLASFLKSRLGKKFTVSKRAE